MIIETFTALGAISLGASIGVYLVASEASLPSFHRTTQRLAWWARDKDDAATVAGGLPWRIAVSNPAMGRDEGGQEAAESVRIEAFCALCEEALEGLEPWGTTTDDSMVSPRCGPCGVRYPLTEGMLLHEVIAIARRELLARPTEGSSALATAGGFAQQ